MSSPFFSKFILLWVLLVSFAHAQELEKLVLKHSDQFEVVLQENRYVTYVVGHVVFKTETGYIYCDSARWLKGQNVRLNGHVLIDDETYRLSADSTFYDINSSEALARGQRVELWSYEDSLYAVGTHAFFADKDNYFYMENRPTLWVGYPDTATMIEVIANTIRYDASIKRAEAVGDVKISSQDFSSSSECAVMSTELNTVDLFQNPSVRRGESVISGQLISIYFDDEVLKTIDVVDSAKGEFNEPTDTTNTYFDKSLLSGRRIVLDFEDGKMNNVVCWGQAYSWYYPSAKGGNETHENAVSGDTIRFFVENEELQKVNVIGGAIGRYQSGKREVVDTSVVWKNDTVDYSGEFIEYRMVDSMITLSRAAHVQSGTVALDAHEVEFDTRRRLIEAYSGYVPDTVDTRYSLSAKLQPNLIPVILRDKKEEIYGDYLLYSIDTEKGRIVQSKSAYDAGYYYGRKLFREQKDIYYVDDGRYTTCNAEEPHFHFHSKNMKLIEGDKLIARPVVLYIERLPILALPYYVFPLKKGRHSGILPFSFGRFEKGERYVSNLGYYWAASEYWDWQGAMDYYETTQTMRFKSQVKFKKRYVLDGNVSGEYGRETSYNSISAQEIKKSRWAFKGNYNHIVTPSFSVKAYGDFRSDKAYYTDYSQNLDERLNNTTKSQISFSKSFGKSTSVSGTITHDVNWVAESRTDQLPSMSLTLPSIFPFGNGSRDENGVLKQKWYHKFSLRYAPTLLTYSSRVTKSVLDTLTFDTSGLPVLLDTTYYRSRKEFTRIVHNPRLTLPPLVFGNYLTLTPSISYNESWARIYETDQSLAAGLDASRIYRTYSYSGAVTATTKLYGTVYPNIAGVTGLRHTLTPTVTYSYTPTLNRHPEVRSYVGGMAGNTSKSSIVNISLNQLFQTRLKKDEVEQSYQILSITSGFSYNFLNPDRPYSDLSTSITVSSLPLVDNLNISMIHSLYNPDTGERSFLHPYRTSFDVNTSLSVSGRNFLFDDTEARPLKGADSASQLDPAPSPGSPGSSSKGWSLYATYYYSEDGRGSSWSKSSFVQLTLRFALTATTNVTFTQNYDIGRQRTIHQAVNIIKKIHCWTGSIYWVPSGSNRGFGFSLAVTEIPQLKIDNNYNDFLGTLQSSAGY